MSFFQFRQNNSYGTWEGPAVTVIIEAADADEANWIAQSNGLYFDGVRAGRDCGCCGDRWSRTWDDEKGDPEQMIWDEPVTEESTVSRGSALPRGDVPEFLIVRKDGTEVPPSPIEERTRNVLKDPGTPEWAKDVIRLALDRDPVDAASVLGHLSDLFNDRRDAILSESESKEMNP